MKINLDGVKMNVVSTSPNGVVDAETVFHFHQEGDAVWAEYEGGQIQRGFLVGILEGSTLKFRYCQGQTDGDLDGGASVGEVGLNNGRVRIVERFDWASREGGGINIFEELDTD